MPDLHDKIASKLDSPQMRQNLTSLFTETLRWGAPKSQPRSLSMPEEPEQRLTATPVSQLSGLPVFRIDWPLDKLPSLEHRRTVYKALAPLHIEHLLCYVTSDSKQAAFVWARKRDSKVELRTLPYEVGSPARTTIEQLGEIAFTYQELGLFGEPSVTAVLDKLNAAFNVDAVTKRFFTQYRLVFDRVEALVEGITEGKRLFTQRLFNRLMFIAFIQKKGWLNLNGRTDYLFALWDAYRRDPAPTSDFYTSRLHPLFFSGLNNRDAVNMMVINNGGFLKDLIGDVPYLNGGLFDKHEDDKNDGITVPNPAIEAILHDLFARFNFTVTESTPFDVEVAVDPEMLGKVFEELVTDRHGQGAYYTPKPIVSFMCREALKGYLKAQLPGEAPKEIDEFVDDEHDPIGLRDPEAILGALKAVKVCDPACGSGAYLLGMLHELLVLRAALFVTRHVDPISTYHRKLEIIQNSLYGVDLDEFAINIAQLRLWLSLAVDFEGSKPEPLPNLDFKIERGDSVTGPAPHTAEPDSFRDTLVGDYLAAKELFLTAHGPDKPGLKEDIKALREQIKSWTSGGSEIGDFDWQLDFAEVFQQGGFDIVVANPPYVRQELIRDLKPALKKAHPEVYTGVADLYIFFYSRALQLLNKSGMLVFISSNKWFRANYGAGLRKHIGEMCHVLSITDFGDLPVFESATAYPMIFIAQRGIVDSDMTLFTHVNSLEPPYPDVRAIIHENSRVLTPGVLSGSNWIEMYSSPNNSMYSISTPTTTLDHYVRGHFYRGVVTGFNTAFVIDSRVRDELIAQDSRSADIIKKLAVGKDIRRWQINFRDRWLIFTRRGVNVDQYPAVKAYLARWIEELTPKQTGEEEKGRKPGHYKWYEIQDETAYYEEFAKPKIVYPGIMIRPNFAYDDTGAFTNQKCFIITDVDHYLLGLLNSSLIWNMILQSSPDLRGGFAEPRKELILSLPIAQAPAPDYTAITDLVQKCLDLKGVGCEAYEREIDERVAKLYGLGSDAITPVVTSSLGGG